MVVNTLTNILEKDTATSKERMIGWNRSFAIFTHATTITTCLGILVALQILFLNTSSIMVISIYTCLGLTLMLYIHCGVRLAISLVLEKTPLNKERKRVYYWITGVLGFMASAALTFVAPPFMSNLVEIGFLQSNIGQPLKTKQKRITNDKSDPYGVGYVYI